MMAKRNHQQQKAERKRGDAQDWEPERLQAAADEDDDYRYALKKEAPPRLMPVTCIAKAISMRPGPRTWC